MKCPQYNNIMEIDSITVKNKIRKSKTALNTCNVCGITDKRETIIYNEK